MKGVSRNWQKKEKNIQYKLYHDNIFIGKIIQKDEDFPNLYGKFEIEKNNLPTNIIDYIEYSIECSRLMDKDENLWIKYIEDKEHNYLELIESEKWYLINSNGKIENILVPLFGDNDITWRWNF